MARKTSVRVILNREAVERVKLAVADGMGRSAANIVEKAVPNDAPPYGEGLIEAGDWGVWVGGKKVAGTAAKPRGLRMARGEIVAVGGYGFPARFHERGTSDTAPHPFLDPSFAAYGPETPEHVRAAVEELPRG